MVKAGKLREALEDTKPQRHKLMRLYIEQVALVEVSSQIDSWMSGASNGWTVN